MTLLAHLPIGARGRVLAIHDTDEIGLRLLEMGVTPGVEVTVAGCAPLGDPLELEVRGYRLSVRRSEARCIEVEPL